ncbi:chloroplast phenylalanine hydroxylase [Raphidocelis subcapitata]|uniref:phenylalanine 4-monooxygenase n=1 Tax=Raphidocelis subcapitata TaxID=307507 RepID=A0A2V0PJD4_9CHLO|nr:chloroplast phenylalanine hydroxylase [Raphidocelis subcapitata]|eukprot:GBF97155.1 chloroplast phenylalanine hydroxylase [Raphidocelis subcapitata]
MATVIEYAKTARASCKGPKKPCEEAHKGDRHIPQARPRRPARASEAPAAAAARAAACPAPARPSQGALRVGRQREVAEHTATSWYHLECISKKVVESILEEVEDLADIPGFDSLKPADQQRVRKHFDGAAAPAEAPAAKRGRPKKKKEEEEEQEEEEESAHEGSEEEEEEEAPKAKKAKAPAKKKAAAAAGAAVGGKKGKAEKPAAKGKGEKPAAAKKKAAPKKKKKELTPSPSASEGSGGGGGGEAAEGEESDERSISSTAAAAAARAPAPAPLVRVPTSIAEVDNGSILGFGADLAPDHPGYHDEAYKRRRVAIAELARAHKIGEPIPRIDYSPEEVAVWGLALRELRRLFPTHACAEFNHTLPLLDFREDEIPQLQDISDALTAASGWKIRPVAGLMHPRDFLNGLAFKYFHSTQARGGGAGLIGHVPMLADPDFAAMVQAIGRASLGADERTIWHLTKCYWYTVEFGVVREGGGVKAFGAGILSSYGELQWMASGAAELAAFDPYAPQPKMSYKDGYQRRYFALDSFQEGARLLQRYAAAPAVPPPQPAQQPAQQPDAKRIGGGGDGSSGGGGGPAHR